MGFPAERKKKLVAERFERSYCELGVRTHPKECLRTLGFPERACRSLPCGRSSKGRGRWGCRTCSSRWWCGPAQHRRRRRQRRPRRTQRDLPPSCSILLSVLSRTALPRTDRIPGFLEEPTIRSATSIQLVTFLLTWNFMSSTALPYLWRIWNVNLTEEVMEKWLRLERRFSSGNYLARMPY